MRELARQLVGVELISEVGWRGLTFDDLAGVGLRRNPKRAHLIVSRVLAKHVPVAGSTACDYGGLLAEAVSEALAPCSSGSQDTTLVIGFAETACGLAGLVSDSIQGSALTHTTRDMSDRPSIWMRLNETHSHAPSHHLLGSVQRGMEACDLVVIVDDELSTGDTAWRLVRRLNEALPGRRYVVACLVDARSEARRQWQRAQAVEMGVDLTVVALVEAEILVPPDATERAARVLAEHATDVVHHRTSPVGRSRLVPPLGVCFPDTRHVVSSARRVDAFSELAPGVLEFARSHLSGRTLVLGIEEGMYTAIRVASVLGADVQSTTRSPAVVLDRPGYPLRTGATFPSAYDPAVQGFLYNGPVVTGQPTYENVLLIHRSKDAAGPPGLPPALLAAAELCCSGTVWTLDVGAPAHGGP